MPPHAKNPRQNREPKCSNCGAATVEAYRPFCSKRCADVDLGRWLNGSYAIAGNRDADEDGEGPEALEVALEVAPEVAADTAPEARTKA